MFSFFNWVEIFIGNDIETFFRIQNLLRQHGVNFKTKQESSRDRLNNNIIGGADRSIANLKIANTDTYRILVHKEDEETAQRILYDAKH